MTPINRRIKALETARADALKVYENYPVYTREQIEAMSDAELVAAYHTECQRPVAPQTAAEIEADKQRMKYLATLPDDELKRLHDETMREIDAYFPNGIGG